MNKIFIFGDSYGLTFPKLCMDYCKWKGYVPKTYVDLLNENTNSLIRNFSVGGQSNYGIFESFIDHIHEIEKDDLVIFGWTQILRFRLVDINKYWTNVNSGHTDFKKFYNLEDISNRTCEEILVNRENFLYYNELNNFIKLINITLKNNKVIHWHWSNYQHPISLTIPYLGRLETINDETNKEVNDYHYNEGSHLILFENIFKKIKE